jgi:SAM-dependent methyltransferase
MNNYVDPQAYWENRLTTRFDLTGVGYLGVGPYYNAQMYQARLRAFERLLAHARRRLSGASVLDIGCGTGFYTDYCARQEVGSYVGIDITEISMHTLRQRFPDFQFVQADITSDDWDSSTGYDIVIAADVLYHIVDDRGFGVALQKLCAAVKSGGVLVIADVFPLHTVQTKAHVRLRAQREYELLLRQSGLSIRHIEPIFFALQPPISYPHASWSHRIYSLAWKATLRLMAWRPIEVICARSLGWLDEKVLLHRIAPPTYTVKWLLATGSHGE